MDKPERPNPAETPGPVRPALIMDSAGMIIEWAPEAETIFGQPRAEAIGKRLSAVIIPERHRAAHEAGLKRFLAAGRGTMLDRAIEIVALHADGHEFSVEIQIAAEKTPDGYRFATSARRL